MLCGWVVVHARTHARVCVCWVMCPYKHACIRIALVQHLLWRHLARVLSAPAGFTLQLWTTEWHRHRPPPHLVVVGGALEGVGPPGAALQLVEQLVAGRRQQAAARPVKRHLRVMMMVLCTHAQVAQTTHGLVVVAWLVNLAGTAVGVGLPPALARSYACTCRRCRGVGRGGGGRGGGRPRGAALGRPTAPAEAAGASGVLSL